MGLHEFDFQKKDPDPILEPNFTIGDLVMSIVTTLVVISICFLVYLIAKISVIAAVLLVFAIVLSED